MKYFSAAVSEFDFTTGHPGHYSKAGLEACLINLQRCDESAVQEVLKMAPAGSFLDAKGSASSVVDRIGALMQDAAEAINEPNSLDGWERLKKIILAVGDCSEDASSARMETFASSKALISAFSAVIMAWNDFFRNFQQYGFEECSVAHSCYHGSVYVLSGMVSSSRSSQCLISTLTGDSVLLSTVFLIAELLQEEIQYSTQELVLEFLSRLFICYAKKKTEKKELLAKLPLPINKAFSKPVEGPLAVLSDLRKYLQVVNEKNPNLVSCPVSSVSLSNLPDRRSVGVVSYIDLGYDALSFLLRDGPNVLVRYQQLTHVVFSESKNTVQFAVDTSSGNLDSFFRFLKVAPSAEIELTFVIDRGDIKAMPTLKSVIENRLQSLSDALREQKCSAVSSNKGDQYSSAKKASLPRRPAATLNFLDSTSCRLPINKNELLQQKVDVERSFLTLMKENKSPMSPQVESNTQVVTPTRSCKKDVSVFSETKQIHASSKRKFGTEILSKKRESVLSMRKKQKLDLGDAEELYFANQGAENIENKSYSGEIDEKHGDICKQSSDSVSITDADETDQSSAMSLLLNELLSMNQLRARKKRERNILHAISVAVEQVSSYLENWNHYACGASKGLLVDIRADLETTTEDVISICKSMNIFYENIESASDAFGPRIEILHKDIEQLTTSVKEFAQFCHTEDNRTTSEIASRSKFLYHRRFCSHHSAEDQKATADAIAVLSKLEK